MPEMPFRTVISPTHDADTPLKKQSKILIRAVLIFVPLLLDKSLQLRKELFNRIKIWGVGWKIQQLDACFMAHLFDSLTVMKRGIIHDKNRHRLGVGPTMVKKLLDIILEQSTVGRSL